MIMGMELKRHFLGHRPQGNKKGEETRSEGVDANETGVGKLCSNGLR